MLSSTDLWRLLIRSGSRLIDEARPARRELTRQICDCLGEAIDESGTVKPEQIQNITEQLFSKAQASGRHPTSRRQFARRVEIIMAELNALPGLTLLLPPHSQPLHRPTLSVTTLNEAHALEALQFVDKNLQAWRKRSRHPDRWLLELALRLSCRVGLGSEVLIGTLAMLRADHVKEAMLELPVQLAEARGSAKQEDSLMEDTDDACLAEAADGVQPTRCSPPSVCRDDANVYPLTLPTACRGALAHIRRCAKGHQNAWLLLPSPNLPVPRLNIRQRQLRKRLDQVAKVMLKELKVSHPEARALLNRLSGWGRMARTGPLLCQHRGTPSIWLEIVARYPLPTTTPEPLLLADTSGGYAPGNHNSRRDRLEETRLSNVDVNDLHTAPPGIQERELEPLTAEQSAEVRQVLRRFVVELSTLTEGKRLTSQAVRRPLRQRVQNGLTKLTEITGTSLSYAHLLLHFAYSRLREHGNTISSVSTYLSRLTPSPIIFHELIVDLESWDQESLDEICHDALNYAKWGVTTQRHFLRTMSMFVHFCQAQGLLEDVELPAVALDKRVSTRRTAVANPDMADHTWFSLVGHANPSQINQQYALAFALGYYAGLRASEVCQLTLADILIERKDGDEWPTLHSLYAQGLTMKGRPGKLPECYCWIYIEEGKTSAARRRVPLHILAPPDVVEKMSRWWETRRAVAPNTSVREIALFGPLFSPRAYTRRGLIDPLISWLRGRWGTAIDYHGLRHAAVSWLQLRMHAALYPTFRDKLAHRHHWVFADASLAALNAYLCSAEGEHSIERGALLGHLAQMIGHRHVSTLTQTYSHTLPVIHADVLQRVWSNKQ